MAVKQMMLPANRAFDSNGFPEAGATAQLYLSGTSTPAVFYADEDLSVSLGSLITANSAGRFTPMPYQSNTTAFRLVIRDAEGVTLDDIDPFYFGTTHLELPSATFTSITNLSEATAENGASAYLAEEGREGVFVFDTSDLTSEVTADTLQGIYIAPTADPTGASGAWVRQFDGPIVYDWFGLDGVDDTPAFHAANAMASFTGKNHTAFGSDLTCATPIVVSQNGLTIDGRGSKLTQTIDTFNQAIGWTGNGITVNGLWIDLPGAGAVYLNTSGAGFTYNEVRISRPNYPLSIPHYLSVGADGFRATNCRFEWYGGFNCFTTSDLWWDRCDFINPFTSSNDDAIALKATTGNSYDIRVTNCYFEGHANFVGFGSQIGTQGAADPTYSNGVYNVLIDGNTGKNCGSIAYIKPGAINPSNTPGDGYDFRDGTVANVVISNNLLRDPTGLFFNRGIILTAGRGARLINIIGRNNIIEARASTSPGLRLAGCADLYIPDFSSNMAGTAAPVIKDVDLAISFRDPYGGVAAGGSAPGGPVSRFVSAEKQTVAHGTVSNITLDIIGDGCSLSGIRVQEGFDNAFTVRRAKLTNVDTNGSANFGCIHTDSAIFIGSELSLEVASGSSGVAYKLGASGSITPLLPKQLAALSVVGNSTNAVADTAAISAGTDGHVLRRSGSSVGFGTVATAGIANDAVTYAKIQNVSATDKLLGRSTAGAGDVEEIACTAAGRALIDDADAEAQRTTLGLGTAAVLNTADVLQSANNLSDVASAATVAKNLGIGFALAQSGTPTTHTGNTTETTVKTITVPANTLDANGQLEIRVLFTKSGTAGAAIYRIKFGGTAFHVVSPGATTLSYETRIRISNQNNTSVQAAAGNNTVSGTGTTTVAAVAGAIDTTASQDILLTVQNGNAADTVGVASFQVIAYPKA